MRHWKSLSWVAVWGLALSVAACGDDKSPTTPTPATANITAPGLQPPDDNAQADTLRPTLTVKQRDIRSDRHACL